MQKVSTQKRRKQFKCFPYRPYDYMYDPIFNVSGPVDHYKAAISANMSMVKFKICPIFANMFSDMTSRPRVQLVRRQQPAFMPYRDKKAYVRKVYNAAYDRIPDARPPVEKQEFAYSIVNLPEEPHRPVPSFTIEKVTYKTYRTHTNIANVHTETKYRESDMQTDPWEPPVQVIGEGDPEILKLQFLKWSDGLPVGVHEVEIIERARMKAAWMQVIKPEKDESSLNMFREYLEELETNEWRFREIEIQKIQELRMQLLEKMIEEVHNNMRTRNQSKMMRFVDRIEEKKQKQKIKLDKETARKLRKLENTKPRDYVVPNIIDAHNEKCSVIYAPLLRHGTNPKNWHYIIDEKLKSYEPQYIGVETISTLPKGIKIHTVKFKGLPRPKSETDLCIKQTKWTAPVLENLYNEMKNLAKDDDDDFLSLRTRIEAKAEKPPTPENLHKPDNEELFQATLLFQKIIKGRATQMIIYEGRDSCKELIQELKHSVGLLKKEKQVVEKHWMKVKRQQREESLQFRRVQQLQDTLGKLQGTVAGSLLDFLNQELRKLIEERKAHAICLTYERERFMREAIEAGKRQKEIRRRKEHDEMFKHIVKVNQDSVDVYLRDIITDGMNFSSHEEAQEYIVKMARKVEVAAKDVTRMTLDQQDEVTTNMVFHFLLPQVNKNLIRENIQKAQKQKLKTVHSTLYSKLETLPECYAETEERLTEEVFDEEPDIKDDLAAYLAYLRSNISYQIGFQMGESTDTFMDENQYPCTPSLRTLDSQTFCSSTSIVYSEPYKTESDEILETTPPQAEMPSSKIDEFDSVNDVLSLPDEEVASDQEIGKHQDVTKEKTFDHLAEKLITVVDLDT